MLPSVTFVDEPGSHGVERGLFFCERGHGLAIVDFRRHGVNRSVYEQGFTGDVG
jgi:hypothetical protein